MAIVRAFRAVNHTYGTLWPKIEPPELVTDAGAFSTAEGAYLALNPWPPFLSGVFFSPGPLGSYNRGLLCEYDTDDVIASGGDEDMWLHYGRDRAQKPETTGGPWTGDLIYKDNGDPVPPEDRPYSRAFVKVTAGTVVDELSLDDFGAVQKLAARSQLDELLLVLAGYGGDWSDWEPSRV